MRLDKYISAATDLSRAQVKRLAKSGAVTVNGAACTNGAEKIAIDALVTLNDKPLCQPGPRYFMLHKPEGYVCSTSEGEHPTVLDLLDEPRLSDLQIVGRLDIDTTGLVLITSDGKWNHAITSPKRNCKKVYYVTTCSDLETSYTEKLHKGLWLDGEKTTTLPADIEYIYSNECRLSISEGRYHQVKRMFAALGNRVEALHREAVGGIQLDNELAPGEYRPLTNEEVLSAGTSVAAGERAQ